MSWSMCQTLGDNCLSGEGKTWGDHFRLVGKMLADLPPIRFFWVAAHFFPRQAGHSRCTPKYSHICQNMNPNRPAFLCRFNQSLQTIQCPLNTCTSKLTLLQVWECEKSVRPWCWLMYSHVPWALFSQLSHQTVTISLSKVSIVAAAAH